MSCFPGTSLGKERSHSRSKEDDAISNLTSASESDGVV